MLCTPPSSILAPYLSAASKHVIIFHLLTDGHGYAHVEGNDRPVPLTPGDVVVFPHGDPHVMRNGSVVKPVNVDGGVEEGVRQVLSLGLKVFRTGGGGAILINPRESLMIKGTAENVGYVSRSFRVMSDQHRRKGVTQEGFKTVGRYRRNAGRLCPHSHASTGYACLRGRSDLLHDRSMVKFARKPVLPLYKYTET